MERKGCYSVHMNQLSLTRRAFCGAGMALVGAPAWAAEPRHDVTFLEDFDELWRTLGERYCFLPDKRTDWDRVRSFYRPMALAAEDDAAFTDVVRRVLAEADRLSLEELAGLLDIQTDELDDRTLSAGAGGPRLLGSAAGHLGDREGARLESRR